jgi:hypothetical protein
VALFQNPAEQFDVNDNGGVTANDALLVINQLSRLGGAAALDPSSEQPNGVFYDTNGDYRITALDALVIINEVGRRANAGETELIAGVSPSDSDDEDDDLRLLSAPQFVGL